MSALNDTFQSIADAIRSKTGKEDPISPSDMADEIMSIPSGGANCIIATEAKTYDVGENDIGCLNTIPFSDEEEMKNLYFGDVIYYTNPSQTYDNGGVVNVSLPENAFACLLDTVSYLYSESKNCYVVFIYPNSTNDSPDIKVHLMGAWYTVSQDCKSISIKCGNSNECNKQNRLIPILKRVSE